MREFLLCRFTILPSQIWMIRSVCSATYALVRDKDDRLAVPHIERLERCEHHLAGLGIKIACRLVGKDERRIVHERPRNRHPLHHAAGKLV